MLQEGKRVVKYKKGGWMKFFITILSFSLIVFSADLNTLIAKAKRGDVKAIFELAYIYENGLGVEKNSKKAYKLYQKAASMGDEDAMIALSLFELNNKSVSHKNISNKVLVKNDGNFLKIDPNDLKELIERAKKNDKDALFTLATLYESGFNNVASDPKKAKALYKKAAKLGSKKAKDVLNRFTR